MLKTLSYLLISLLVVWSSCKRRKPYATSDVAWHYMARGSHNEAIGNKKEAIKDYDTLIKLEPLKPDGYYSRAIIDTSLRDYKGSIRDINKAMSVLPKDDSMRFAVYLDFRGDVKRLSGNEIEALSDYKAAVQIYTRALENYAGNDFAREERSKLEVKLKNQKQP